MMIRRQKFNHPRHWSPQSETYVPVEVLLHYLDSGWIPLPIVTIETFHYASRVTVGHFVLTRSSEQVRLPVLLNPVALRIIERHHLVIQERLKTQVWRDVSLRAG